MPIELVKSRVEFGHMKQISYSLEELVPLATGREQSFFETDMHSRRDTLTSAIAGKRFLVVGGAGSIGSATVNALVSRDAASVHVADTNENGLAELVRNLRNTIPDMKPDGVLAIPMDYGSQIMRRFLAQAGPYDAVLNFAAVKHVRSEKDIFSLLHLLDTNVAKQVRFMNWVQEYGVAKRYFSVSTDKAANPVSMMGASKRIMEHVLFSNERMCGFDAPVTSTRFANVAFSDGSLLQSFLNRIQKRQPLAVPAQTKRYFISMDEAAEICLLAIFDCEANIIAVPKMSPEQHLIDLQDIAERVISKLGFEARIYADGSEAISSFEQDISVGRYPLLVTELNTSGEKPYEEFVAENEKLVDLGLGSLDGVEYLPAPKGTLLPFYELLTQALDNNSPIDKAELVRATKNIVPQFQHVDSKLNLDQRM